MLEPGAIRSTACPMFEKLESTSALVDDATVTAVETGKDLRGHDLGVLGHAVHRLARLQVGVVAGRDAGHMRAVVAQLRAAADAGGGAGIRRARAALRGRTIRTERLAAAATAGV